MVYSLIVLPVLIHLVGVLLDRPFRPPQVLLGVAASPRLCVHLRLKLTDASLHLSHRLLASLQGVLLSLIKSSLGILNLSLQELLVPFKSHSQVLLHPQFVCQPCCVNHCTLSLVLGHACLGGHLVQIVAEGGHLLLALHLGALNGLICAGLVAERLVGVSQLLLHVATVPVSLLQQGPSLLQCILVCVCTSVSGNEVVLGCSLCTVLLLKLGLHAADVVLQQLDVALALSIGGIGMLKGHAKVNDVVVKLLLHAQCLNFALGFGLKSHLHCLKGLAKVFLGGCEFVLLLGNPSLNLLLHLGQLEGGAENLVLLLLKCSFSLAQCCLQFHLLGLETLPDFVNLVDGAAALADLVHDVLDLI